MDIGEFINTILDCWSRSFNYECLYRHIRNNDVYWNEFNCWYWILVTMERGKKMKKILIKESDLIKLIETAMDLDIYSQPSQFDTNNGNLDAEETVEDIISKLKELLYMLKSGKKINTNSKSEIYKTFDNINKTFSNIKYNSQS